MNVSTQHFRGRRDAATAGTPNRSLIARLVQLSVARAWIVLAVVIILCAATTQYVMSNFAMTTDTDTLLSSTLCRPGHAPALTPAKRFIFRQCVVARTDGK